MVVYKASRGKRGAQSCVEGKLQKKTLLRSSGLKGKRPRRAPRRAICQICHLETKDNGQSRKTHPRVIRPVTGGGKKKGSNEALASWET